MESMKLNELNKDIKKLYSFYTMVPEKFTQVWKDFKADLLLTFPELADKLAIEEEAIYTHCVALYPKLFFELLYENASMFEEPRSLLPDIDFSVLMKDEKVSDKTKKTIWKYLQLLLFSVMENVESKETIGDTSKLFEAIHQDDLHKKISETMEEMKGLFDFSDASGTPPQFDAENLKSHLDGLMGGKIGALAKEIAGEATSELEGIEDKEEFMKKLMKNPAKILDLVKNIGSKLEDKIKKGDLKESELLEEASQIMEKMQDIPGMKEMMGKMGMGGKVDFKAMSNKIQENLRKSKMKDRLNKKREDRAAEKIQKEEKINITQKTENTFIVKVDDSVQEKSTPKKKKKGKK
jgi:hypothetical protein